MTYPKWTKFKEVYKTLCDAETQLQEEYRETRSLIDAQRTCPYDWDTPESIEKEIEDYCINMNELLKALKPIVDLYNEIKESQ